jgi:hypothetical protein
VILFRRGGVIPPPCGGHPAPVPLTPCGTAVVTLPTDTQILITREFDAPKHLVYKAWTTPELIKRWWSGDRSEVTIAEVDLRVGGTWRYVTRSDGSPGADCGLAWLSRLSITDHGDNIPVSVK